MEKTLITHANSKARFLGYDITIRKSNQPHKGKSGRVQRQFGNKIVLEVPKTLIPIEIHHVRKLKNLSGKNEWERVMQGRRRKTMALCHNCHVNLHKGTLSQQAESRIR